MSTYSYDVFHTTAGEIIKHAAVQTEQVLLEQLNEFIKRDLIVIQKGPTSLVFDENSHAVRLQQPVRLVLKDQEYIEKLENRVSELEAIISKIKESGL